VSDQVSHPYKTTNKIIVLCVLIFILLDSQLEDKSCCIKRKQAFPDFSLLWSTLLRLLNFKNSFPDSFSFYNILA
jgi:hypothetical protein